MFVLQDKPFYIDHYYTVIYIFDNIYTVSILLQYDCGTISICITPMRSVGLSTFMGKDNMSVKV